MKPNFIDPVDLTFHIVLVNQTGDQITDLIAENVRAVRMFGHRAFVGCDLWLSPVKQIACPDVLYRVHVHWSRSLARHGDFANTVISAWWRGIERQMIFLRDVCFCYVIRYREMRLPQIINEEHLLGHDLDWGGP